MDPTDIRRMGRPNHIRTCNRQQALFPTTAGDSHEELIVRSWPGRSLAESLGARGRGNRRQNRSERRHDVGEIGEIGPGEREEEERDGS